LEKNKQRLSILQSCAGSSLPSFSGAATGGREESEVKNTFGLLPNSLGVDETMKVMMKDNKGGGTRVC
jgi:hypothetical protein